MAGKASKKGKKSRRFGKHAAQFKAYTISRTFEKNKVKKLKRALTRNPNCASTITALTHYKEAVSGFVTGKVKRKIDYRSKAQRAAAEKKAA